MTKTLILGIGGAGCAIAYQLQDALDYPAIALNTDTTALNSCPLKDKLLLGPSTCGGRAAGVPTLGERAVVESWTHLTKLLPPTGRLLLVAGFGGGTGSGALPAIAYQASELGLEVLAVITLPFLFEQQRRQIADTALQKLTDSGIKYLIHDHAGTATTPSYSLDDALSQAGQSIITAAIDLLGHSKQPHIQNQISR